MQVWISKFVIGCALGLAAPMVGAGAIEVLFLDGGAAIEAVAADDISQDSWTMVIGADGGGLCFRPHATDDRFEIRGPQCMEAPTSKDWAVARAVFEDAAKWSRLEVERRRDELDTSPPWWFVLLLAALVSGLTVLAFRVRRKPKKPNHDTPDDQYVELVLQMMRDDPASWVPTGFGEQRGCHHPEVGISVDGWRSQINNVKYERHAKEIQKAVELVAKRHDYWRKVERLNDLRAKLTEDDDDE